MKFKPVITLVLIVVLPLTLLAWVGVRLARHERQVREQQVKALLTDRLRDVDRRVMAHFQQLQRELQLLTAIDHFDPVQLRETSRMDPRLLQMFVIRPDGNLLYPDPLGSLNRHEEEFLTQASQIIADRELQRTAAALATGANRGGEASLPADGWPAGTAPAPGTSGWLAWYWGRGLNLVYWQYRGSGYIVAAALDRPRWIADLIAALPDTLPAASGNDGGGSQSLIRLVDSTAKPVYQWGQYDPPDGAAADCELALSEPLSAWRLQQFVPAEVLGSRATSGIYFNLATGLALAAAGLIALATFHYRQHAREIREASQRVSFVNQVSHELRTPLTNIRMYADLLDIDLNALPDEATDGARTRLAVIQLEIQRLSRLITNVLTFARQQRKSLRLNRSACCIDEVVQRVVARFQPSLEQAGVRSELNAGAGRMVKADSDAIEQIVGNLFHNVEKYAAGGKWLSITTRQIEGRTEITVADRGPGIDAKLHEKVFQPFWRGDHRVSGVAGTGIGLSIARELARLHGGDVRLVDSQEGAAFQVDLETPELVAEGIPCTS